jgi:hypothetical protein
MKEALLAISLIANALIGYHAYDVERRLIKMAEDGPSGQVAYWQRQRELIESEQLKEVRSHAKAVETQVEFLSTLNGIPWKASEYRAQELSSN